MNNKIMKRMLKTIAKLEKTIVRGTNINIDTEEEIQKRFREEDERTRLIEAEMWYLEIVQLREKIIESNPNSKNIKLIDLLLVILLLILCHRVDFSLY